MHVGPGGLDLRCIEMTTARWPPPRLDRHDQLRATTALSIAAMVCVAAEIRATLVASMQPTFFPTPAAFHEWLAEHHSTAGELLVGFYKKGTGEPSITWPESVDEALCFGWIDGIRRRIDDRRYSIRFTPRRPGSTWSEKNIARARELLEEGRLQAAGVAAFEARRENRSGVYSYEQRRPGLEPPYEQLLRRDAAAWEFFQAQPPSYRKVVSWWIVSAKREDTRLRRLEKLRACSAEGSRIPEFLAGKGSR